MDRQRQLLWNNGALKLLFTYKTDGILYSRGTHFRPVIGTVCISFVSLTYNLPLYWEGSNLIKIRSPHLLAIFYRLFCSRRECGDLILIRLGGIVMVVIVW